MVARGADAQADSPTLTTDEQLELHGELCKQAMVREATRINEVAYAVSLLLLAVGEDPERDGLVDTPARVGAMWGELVSGMNREPSDVLRTKGGGLGFECADYDELVVLRGIEFVSMCEHHLMPFYGTAAVAYIPDGQVVGVSKLARLVEVFARRLQIQERMTTQIADTLEEAISPKGVAVVIEATHMCMVARGVKKRATMATNEMRGVFREDPRARAEVLASLKG